MDERMDKQMKSAAGQYETWGRGEEARVVRACCRQEERNESAL